MIKEYTIFDGKARKYAQSCRTERILQKIPCILGAAGEDIISVQSIAK